MQKTIFSLNFEGLLSNSIDMLNKIKYLGFMYHKEELMN
jgi:hypothetical protein